MYDEQKNQLELIQSRWNRIIMRDLPESERKLTVNFMAGHVFWINKNHPTQWFNFALSAYYIPGS